MSRLPALPSDPWQAAATAAVVADADVGLLSFTGPDAAAFLQGQVSSDVNALAAGMGQRSTYNSPKGRMLATLFVARLPGGAGDRFVALLAADVAGRVAKRLAMYVLRSRVAIADETSSLAPLGVGGPAAEAAVAAALGEAPPRGGVAAVDGTTVVHLPEGRLVVLADAAVAEAVRRRLEAHATPAPRAVWAWLGIRAAVPTVTAATQDLFVAQTANQDALGALDFRKGCYTGQEIVARMQYLGRLKERMVVLAGAGDPPAPGTRVYAPAFGEQACGTVVDSAPRPDGGSLMLAVLQTAAAGGPVTIGAPDGPPVGFEPLPYALPEPAERRGRVRL